MVNTKQHEKQEMTRITAQFRHKASMPHPIETSAEGTLLPLFTQYSLSHFAALAVAAILGTWVIRHAGKQNQAEKHRTARILGWLCLAVIPGGVLATNFTVPSTPWEELLPLHFCDIMLVCCAWSMFKPYSPLSNCTYFCSLAATAQALITPSLEYDYPTPLYFSFFTSHSLVILCALFIPLVFKWVPKSSGKFLAQLFGICYLIAIYPINILLNTNFGFVLHIPESDSILSLFGPWPWYLVVMQIPGFIIIFFLDIPFHIIRSRQINYATKQTQKNTSANMEA